jgi:hypothetical protein
MLKTYQKESSESKNEKLKIFNYFEVIDSHRKEKIRKLRKEHLWEIPQPEEVTFDGRGEKKVFHYTMDFNLNTIMKYGVIFGDVTVGESLDGINAPNLTTESRFHLPANTQKGILEKNDYYRLSIKCPTDADKLFNMEWFDKVYCLNQTRNMNRELNKNKNRSDIIGNTNGDLHKQYIYKGHITPKMIKEFCRWNKKTQYWDRVNKKTLSEICSRIENFPFNRPSETFVFSITRMLGTRLSEDTTGMVEKYLKETDHKEVFVDLYKLTDWLVLNLNQRLLKNWRKEIWNAVQKTNKTQSMDSLFAFAVNCYNRFNKNDEVDLRLIMNNFNQKKKDFIDAMQDYKRLPAIV